MTCADVACVTSPRAYVAGSEVQQACVAREARGRYWRRVEARGARAREAETSAGAWRRV